MVENSHLPKPEYFPYARVIIKFLNLLEKHLGDRNKFTFIYKRSPLPLTSSDETGCWWPLLKSRGEQLTHPSQLSVLANIYSFTVDLVSIQALLRCTMGVSLTAPQEQNHLSVKHPCSCQSLHILFLSVYRDDGGALMPVWTQDTSDTRFERISLWLYG